MGTREITPRDELTVVKLLARNGNTLGFVSLSTSLPTNAIQVIAERYGWPDREELRRNIARIQEAIDAEERAKNMPRASFEVFQRPQPASRPAPTPTPPARPAAEPVAAQPKPADPVEKDEPPAQVPASAEWERTVELGSQSHRAATRALAKKLLSTWQQLRDALKDEAEYRVQQQREAEQQRKVQEEIATLEAQLAAARAKLKPGKNAAKSAAAAKSGSSEGSLRALQERHAYQKTFLARHAITVADLKLWARNHGFTVGGGGLVARVILDAYQEAHSARAVNG